VSNNFETSEKLDFSFEKRLPVAPQASPIELQQQSIHFVSSLIIQVNSNPIDD